MSKPTKGRTVIGNIIFYCFMAIALICSVTVIFQRQNNAVPKIFGFSHVKVLSESMGSSGFKTGDSVILQARDGYKAGDYVAFYRYADPFNPLPNVGSKPQYGISDAAKSGAQIWFHEVVEVVTDSAGNRWYKTKGTSNEYADSGLIRGDFVVGSYVHAPAFITKGFAFMSSMWGILALVILPNGMLLILLTIQLSQYVDEYRKNKKVKIPSVKANPVP